MASPAAGRRGPAHRAGHHARPRHRRVRGTSRVTEAGESAPRGSAVPLTNGIGQGHEIVFVRISGQWPGVTHQLPAARSRDPGCMTGAQVPGMRLTNGRERSHDGGRIRIDERQRRHREVGAAGPAAATRNIHVREAIARSQTRTAGHAQPNGRRCPTVTNHWKICHRCECLRSPTIRRWQIPAAPGEVAGPAPQGGRDAAGR